MGMLASCCRWRASQWRRWSRCRAWNRWCSMKCCSGSGGGGWIASGYARSALAVEAPGASACLPPAAMPSTATYPTGPLASAPSHPRLVTALDVTSKCPCPPLLNYIIYLLLVTSHCVGSVNCEERISVLISLLLGIGLLLYMHVLHCIRLCWQVIKYMGLLSSTGL